MLGRVAMLRSYLSLVLEALASHRGAQRMMAERWRDAHTLRVIRREPYSTAAAKILPLHLVEKGAAQRAEVSP